MTSKKTLKERKLALLEPYIKLAEDLNQIIADGAKSEGWAIPQKNTPEATADIIRLMVEKDGWVDAQLKRMPEALTWAIYHHGSGDFRWGAVLLAPAQWRKNGKFGNMFNQFINRGQYDMRSRSTPADPPQRVSPKAVPADDGVPPILGGPKEIFDPGLGRLKPTKPEEAD